MMKKLAVFIILLAGFLSYHSALAADITQTPLTTGEHAGVSSQNTASISVSANKLVLVTVFNVKSGGATLPTVISQQNMTWVQMNTDFAGNNNVYRITLFRSMSSVATSGVLTIDYGGNTQVRGGWIISEFGNVDTTGTNGSGAIVQSTSTNRAGTTVTSTLAAFSDVNNATFGTAISVNDSTNVLPGSGFTEIADINVGFTNQIIQSQWKTTNDTTVDWDDNSTLAVGMAGIAAELKNATQTPAASERKLRGVGITR